METRIRFIALVAFLTLGLIAMGCGSDPAPEKQAAGSEQKTTAVQRGAADLEALHKAAFAGKLQAVRDQLEAGVEVDGSDSYGRTALMLAAFNGHTDVVRILLDRGAGIDIRNTVGRTALMHAASGPYANTVKLLLERKADPNLADNVENWTALMFAAGEGQTEVVKLLLDHGADPSLKDADGDTALDFARKNKHTETLRVLEEARE
jgi:ankyrin repeat protein